MASAEQFGQAFDELVTILNQREMEPAPGRGDWQAQREKLREASEILHKRILDPLEPSLPDFSEDDRQQLRRIAATLSGSVAAVLEAAGDRSSASDLRAKACIAAGDTELRAEMEAATRVPEEFGQLVWARWLRRAGKSSKAQGQLERMAKQAREPLFREIAAALLESPTPISSAPSLFTVNGCGVSMYGSRDPHPDGSHVATTYITLVFVPVFPLSAYRVVPQGDGRFLFLGKVPLWKPLVWFRRMVGVAALVAVAALGAQSWLESPGRQAARAVAHARSVEQSGDRAQALEAYSSALAAWEGKVDDGTLAPAAQAWLRLRTGAVKEPFTAAQVEDVGRLMVRFDALSPGLRSGEGAELLRGKLLRWAEQLGEADLAALEAGSRLLTMAERVPGSDKAALQARKANLRRKAAALLEADWPLEAIAQLAQAGSDEVTRAQLAALAAKLDRDEVLAEAREDLEPWLAAAGQASPEAAVIRERLERAAKRRLDPELAKLLESGDEKALRAALAASPKDSWLTVGLAEAQRVRGASPEAIATLQTLGAPGWTVARAQRLLASCHVDVGELAKAEALLERYVSRRLPRFQAARQAYVQRAEATEEGLINQAKNGRLPDELEKKMQGAAQERQRELFQEWMSAQLDRDAELVRLREDYLARQDVVPASIALGTVKLRLASGAKGEERGRLLSDAERAFLAIRQEGADSPAFHLGLGQVLHRLGKAEEGDKELSALTLRGEARLDLAVAEAYRELGLLPKARALTQQLFERDGVDKHFHDEAALMLSVMASTLEEKEKWLGQAGNDARVKLDLANIRGERLLQEGRLAEADKEFAVVAAAFARDAAHSGAAANNAALGYRRRFAATGDPAHLEKATQMLEAAARLTPDNAIVLDNLAEMLEERAVVEVVGKAVHLRSLPLAGLDLDDVLERMLAGKAEERVVAELRASPWLRRSLELSRQVEVLAPRSADAWERLSRWYRRLHDDAAAKALRERLAQVKELDTTRKADQLASWEKGEQDGAARRMAEAALRDLAQARTKEVRHPATVAAIDLAACEHQQHLALLDSDPAAAKKAVEMLRPSQGAQELDVTEDLASALLMQAVLEASAADPELKKQWKERFRSESAAQFAWGAARRSEKVRGALAKHPAVAEAVSLRRSARPDRLKVADWAMGWLSGDTALQQAARANLVLRDEEEKILRKLEPDTPREKAYLAFRAAALAGP